MVLWFVMNLLQKNGGVNFSLFELTRYQREFGTEKKVQSWHKYCRIIKHE
jgi:hypothetical protein